MELEKLLTPEELAERLNVKLGWIYRHSAPGCDPPSQRLPVTMVGKKLRFRPSEVARWLREQETRQNPVSRDAESPSSDSEPPPGVSTVRVNGNAIS